LIQKDAVNEHGFISLIHLDAVFRLRGTVLPLGTCRAAPVYWRHMRFQTLYEGRWIFAVVVLLGAIGAALGWSWLIGIAALLFIFCLNFFRDPDRAAPADPDAIIAAADGTVQDIVELDETEVVKARQKRVGIFLSVFDVHTNRAPVDGRVSYIQHHPGLYLDARHADATSKNEAMTWAFESARATLVVRQITGAIARRIVPWSKMGDTLKVGDRFGMIRFGSRTEVYMPLDCEVTVKIGDKVKGGETVIARFPAR
jgi:phosphatidylserine decarboxylase